jgi:hypothetical protein
MFQLPINSGYPLFDDDDPWFRNSLEALIKEGVMYDPQYIEQRYRRKYKVKIIKSKRFGTTIFADKQIVAIEFLSEGHAMMFKLKWTY